MLMRCKDLFVKFLILSLLLFVLFSQPFPHNRDLFNSSAFAQEMNILFLHHSTGQVIWEGGVPDLIDQYNNNNGTSYFIEAQEFPKDYPYGWSNYPYDYWNIWVEHAGEEPFMDEPTLEILTQDYQMIIWKHCFPVSDIEGNSGEADVSSDVKSIENYQLQYLALKEKIYEFPETLFIVWTGAAQVRGATTKENAQRAQKFFKWVKEEWDQPGDNIYIWDFFQLETEGGFYLKNQYAASSDDSHPNYEFAERVAPLLVQRIVDVIEGRGDEGSLTGE
jgi:hypothetical protein